MRFFTLDRLGLVKTIEFNDKTAKPAPSKKLVKKVKKPEVAEVDKVERLSLEEFVKENITKIFLKSANQLIFVTVLNRVFSFELDSGKCDCVASSPFEDGLPRQDLMAAYSQDILITCTTAGILTIFDVSDASKPRIVQISLGQNKLGAIAIHPTFPNIIATGGEERDLCVWDCEKYNTESKSIEPIWKAKNVPNDSLDMRVRVNVTCIVWMNEENYTDIAIGTAYSQVRVYNTKKQRRPVLDFNKCGTHPLKTLVFTRNNEFVFSDTLGNVSAISASSGQTTGRYKGIAGAVIDLYACKHNPYLVTVSLDRRLRVFEEMGQRRLVKDIYLKQQLVNVVVDESKDPLEEDEEIEGEQDDYNEEAEEALWEKLPEVGEGTSEKNESKLGDKRKK